MSLIAPPAPPPVDNPEPVSGAGDDPEALIEEARQRTRRRRRRYAAVALAAGAAVGLGFYFGFAGGGTSARPMDALASSPAATPVAAHAGYFELLFVRGHFGGGCCVVYPTWRTAAQLGISPDENIHTRREINGPDENRRATDLLERVLTSLIAGPTPADQELLDEGARDAGYPEGLRSWETALPPSTQLLGVTLSNGIATIDIASDLNPLTERTDSVGNGPATEFEYHLGGWVHETNLLFAQLVLTATQFPFVDGVLFKLDSQPVKAQFWDDPSNNYELVGRPVTRADYENYRGVDAVSLYGPGT
jgi:hypothetical protein